MRSSSSSVAQANALVPNEVANLAFDYDWSPAGAWRKHLHLTQSVVAKRMGVSQAAIVQFEASSLSDFQFARVNLHVVSSNYRAYR